MGSFTIRHEFDCDVDSFWSEIFQSDEFNHRLYNDELAFDRFEVFEDALRKDGKFYREVLVQPKAEVPALLKKVLGDALNYVEKGVWDPSDKKYRYNIVPSRMADRSKISGVLWAEPLPGGGCARLCEMEIKVSVFGVGKVVETFVEKTTRDSYEAATRLTRRFIEENDLSVKAAS